MRFIKEKLFVAALALLVSSNKDVNAQKAGNPVFPGWYADPEGVIIDNQYWIFPTYSAAYEQQIFMDAFSSPDLVNWTKHSKVLSADSIKWANKAMWAPAIIKKENKYYLFFSANDIQANLATGGIGVGVANQPEGPYKDLLGKPLLNKIHNGAQPIDQFVFQDIDNQYYMIYGGWGHCILTKLKDDFTGFLPLKDNSLYKEITPSGYVEGPVMFRKNGKYYFMWSEGGWTTSDYRVAYAIGDSPYGPFNRIGLILQQDSKVATGAGHHSVVNVPGTDDWYIIYHRRPLGLTDGNSRVTCIDKMVFDANGYIKPVVMTFEGVNRRFLDGAATLYTARNFTGDSIKLGKDDFNSAMLATMGYADAGLSSVKLKPGYIVELYAGDDFTGKTTTLDASVENLVDLNFDNQAKSLVVRRYGVTNLSGVFSLLNNESGLAMTVLADRLVNGTNVVQTAFQDKTSQKFSLNYVGNGCYNLVAQNSQKLLSVAKSSKDEAAVLQQWDQAAGDITNVGGQLTAQYLDSPAGETIDKLMDNSNATKYLTAHSTAWVQFVVSGKAEVTGYALTSANDAPERDPQNWVLKASNDELKWDTLDVKKGEDFPSRYQKKTYTSEISGTYKYYRFDMTNNSGGHMQLAEMELIGTPVSGGFDSQKFILQSDGNGYFKLFNKFSDKLLAVTKVTASTPVTQETDTNQPGALWKLVGSPNQVDGQTQEKIKLYPNPTDGFLQVEGLQGTVLMDVYNAVGIKVMSPKTTNIDVRQLDPGVYILRLKTDGSTRNLRFIKK